ncbi:MAG: hypothetical protein QOF76_324 [Solirubrobacteraceae bacterium]|nr:hypothetical protein [Solirubrobacteraceae bacterium]
MLLSEMYGSGDASEVAEAILGLIPNTGVLIVDVNLRVVLMEGEVVPLHGYESSGDEGRSLRDLVPPTTWARLCEHWEAALAGDQRTIESPAIDGLGTYWLHFAPLATNEGAVVGAVLLAQDISERARERDSLQRRQLAVSALGSLGLRQVGLRQLMQHAADALREKLVADFTAVYELVADGGAVLRATAGERGAPEQSPPPDPSSDPSLLIFNSGRPFLSGDIRSDQRFDSPELQGLGMVSMLAAPIGLGADAFGFIGACSRRQGAFVEDDFAFVQSIANVLSTAVERERAAGDVAVAESRIASLWELSLDPLAVISSDGMFLAVNAAWEHVLGWKQEELLGRQAAELIHPDDRDATFETGDPRPRADGAVPEVVNRYLAKDGSWHWFLWSVRLGPDGDLYAVAKDITDSRAESERALRREHRLNEAQRIARIGSWETDVVSGDFTVSESLRSMLSLSSLTVPFDEVLGMAHPADRAYLQDRFERAVVDSQPTVFRAVLPDGSVKIVASYSERVLEDGTVVLARGTVQDVTEASTRELALRRSQERFSQGFDNAPIGMHLVDPESGRYIRVNDSFGRFLGRSAAELITLTVMDVSHPDDVEHAVRAIRGLGSGELPFYVAEKRYVRPDGTVVWGALSVSVALEADGTVDVMFGQVIDITERKQREEAARLQLLEVSWLTEIRQAFEDDRFILHAQPIIDIATGRTVHDELLIRMRDREGELVPPGAFLPSAEQYGLIREIDRWVISRASELAAGGRGLAVNLSGVSLGDETLVAHIESELARTGADPSRLVFEITETALVRAADRGTRLVKQIHERGCRFALDDFGTGYGGFHQLKALPLDWLKIDQEFVRDALAHESDRHVISAIVDLATRFDLRTVAEGVEDQATLDLLARMGVDYAQGFHIGGPASIQA